MRRRTQELEGRRQQSRLSSVLPVVAFVNITESRPHVLGERQSGGISPLTKTYAKLAVLGRQHGRLTLMALLWEMVNLWGGEGVKFR